MVSKVSVSNTVMTPHTLTFKYCFYCADILTDSSHIINRIRHNDAA